MGRHAKPPAIPWLTADIRRYLYGITTAIVPLLVIYGVLDEQTAPLWLALAAQITATATAYAYTPKEHDHDSHN